MEIEKFRALNLNSSAKVDRRVTAYPETIIHKNSNFLKSRARKREPSEHRFVMASEQYEHDRSVVQQIASLSARESLLSWKKWKSSVDLV